MNKPSYQAKPFSSLLWVVLGWLGLVLLAYSPLLFHSELHTACPENDTWNLPVRWSVLSALRAGQIPLWNPLSAFGIPWLATWQTESFYPGTLLFVWKGLAAWNFSGILHLLILSAGVYAFLRASQVSTFWAFFSSSLALLNLCAFNHLGSNSSMDTMAWGPWMFLATRECLEGKPFGTLKGALFLTLQVLAGYPQIIFYTLAGCLAYGIFHSGRDSILKLMKPLALGLLFSAAQWVPSVEYFFINSVRLPAVPDNPHFFLPLENLKTFFDYNALSKGAIPDYVNSPTFFYFNFYNGIIPLLVLLFGFLGFKRLNKNGLFFLAAWVFFIFWSGGFFLNPVDSGFSFLPGFLEPAKSWVLINVQALFTVGFLLEDLFPRPGGWKWVLLAAALLNLLYPIWTHPYETNFTPPNARLEAEAGRIREHLGTGRVLILPNGEEHQALYTPMPDPEGKPLFKHFVPDSNLYAFLPLANFYGSTWPTWGTMDANNYFKYGFPYEKDRLLDLLGVDLLLLPEEHMPSSYKKLWNEGVWTLWQNPSSMGGSFAYSGKPRFAERKNIFNDFARGTTDPREILFLDRLPLTLPPVSAKPPLSAQVYPGGGDYRVITQNATPGWRVWVDGQPGDLYLADGIFMGVPLPRGAGQVQISYEPTSFRLGLFLSLLGLAGMLAFAGYKFS